MKYYFLSHSSRFIMLIVSLSISVIPLLSQSFIEKQKISVSDRVAGDNFGWNSAINGNYAIVGAAAQDKDALDGNILTNARSLYFS